MLTKADFSSDQETRWCPGCGDYAVLASVQSFMPELGIPPDRIVFVTGIGCAGRFVYYMDTYGMHGIHGRAPALATGVATSRPDLSVWVVSGDGDALSIGGNHLIHTLRRNVPLKILLFNNQIYGLTKGQYSPTSEEGKVTKSTPFGSQDHPFNPVSLALGAEASFVARTVDTDKAHMTETLRAAAAHEGAAFVEIYQNCNVFNDGAFDAVRAKGQRELNQIRLEHGRPVRFGIEGERGVARSADGRLEIVDVAEVGEDALIVHDAERADPSLAFELAHLAERPTGPTPIGVFRSVKRPVYGEALARELEEARAYVGPAAARRTAALRRDLDRRLAGRGGDVQHELVHAASDVVLLELVRQPLHQPVGRHVVGGHRGREAADAEVAGLCGELRGEQRAEAAALPVVGDRDGHLGGLGVVDESHEAGDRDQAAHRLRGVFGHQGHMIATVHLGQIAQLRPAETALRREETPLHAVI